MSEDWTDYLTMEELNFKKKKPESWDAKDFIFGKKYYCPICESAECGTCNVLDQGIYSIYSRFATNPAVLLRGEQCSENNKQRAEPENRKFTELLYKLSPNTLYSLSLETT